MEGVLTKASQVFGVMSTTCWVIVFKGDHAVLGKGVWLCVGLDNGHALAFESESDVRGMLRGFTAQIGEYYEALPTNLTIRELDGLIDVNLENMIPTGHRMLSLFK